MPKKKRLKHSVFVSLDDGSAGLVVGSKALRLRGSKLSLVRRFTKVAALLDQPGFAGFKINLKDFKKYIAFASSADLFFEPPISSKSIPIQRAIRAIESGQAMWRPLPSFHPLFAELSDSAINFAFYALENAYFVSITPQFLKEGSLRAKTKKIQTHLRKMYLSESDHYKGLLKALKISETTFRLHDPCPGTHAVFAHFFHLAATDPESLLISASLFETDAGDIETVKAFYKRMGRLTGLSGKAFIDHHLEDLNEGHGEAWRIVFEDRKTIPYSKISKWIADLHTTKHIAELWYDSILASIPYVNSVKRTKPIQVASLIRPKPEMAAVEELSIEKI